MPFRESHLNVVLTKGAIGCTYWAMMLRCSNSRQRAVVQDLTNMWHPYVLFEDIFSARTARAGTPASIIANLEKVIISGMVREAKSRLAIKIDREGWKSGIDHIWVELVPGALKRQCGGINRYTLLGWAVNQDDDIWLSMRGTRHRQKCCTCSLLNSAFFFGHSLPRCVRIVFKQNN